MIPSGSRRNHWRTSELPWMAGARRVALQLKVIWNKCSTLPWLEWTASLGLDALQTLLFVLINIHLCIFFLHFFLFFVFQKLRRKLRRVPSWNIHEGRKVQRSQKFRGRENMHIHTHFLMFHHVFGDVFIWFFLLSSPHLSGEYRAEIEGQLFQSDIFLPCWRVLIYCGR